MKKENSLPVTINNAKVQTCSTQTHQGLLLDQKLNLNEQIQKKLQDITRWLVANVTRWQFVNLLNDLWDQQ